MSTRILAVIGGLTVAILAVLGAMFVTEAVIEAMDEDLGR